MKHEKTIEKIALVCSVILLAVFLFKDAHWFWVDASFLLTIFILTSLTRTLKWSWGLMTFLQGMFISFGLTFLFGALITALGAEPHTIIRSILVGPAEELFKLVPVLIAIVIFKQFRKRPFNLSDFAFLGAMAGGGFSMVEKFFWEGIHFPFTYGPHLGDWYLFGDALGVYAGGGQFGYIGHAAATMLIAIGIGFAWRLAKQYPGKPWQLIPIIVFAWVAIEHIILNSYYAGADAIMILGGGMITPWIGLLMLIGVLAWDFLDQRQLLQDKRWKKIWKKAWSIKSVKDVVQLFRFLRVLNLESLDKAYK